MNLQVIMSLTSRIDCLFIAVSRNVRLWTNGASCPSPGTRCGVGYQDFITTNDYGQTK